MLYPPPTLRYLESPEKGDVELSVISEPQICPNKKNGEGHKVILYCCKCSVFPEISQE